MGVVEDERERMRIYELLSAPIPCIAGTTKCNIHVSYLFDFASLLVYQKEKKERCWLCIQLKILSKKFMSVTLKEKNQ